MALDADPRYKWVLRQVRGHFRTSNLETVAFLPSEVEAISEFLESQACRALWFCEGKDSTQPVTVTSIPPVMAPAPTANAKGAGGSAEGNMGYLYLLKLAGAPLDANEPMGDQCMVGDLPPGMSALEHMARVVSEVYLPMCTNPKLREVWSELVMKDVVEGANGFVANVQILRGSVRGSTWLPLPPDSAILEVQEPNLSFEDRVFIDSEGSEAAANRDRVYVLEGAIITWTKQIRSVVLRDPEQALDRGEHPGPLDEINFWQAQSKNLDSIFDQLQTEKVRRVLRYLDRAKSTYTAPFGKLCKEMFLARSKAKSNQKFLRALRPWVVALESEPTFEGLGKHIPPILHTVLLIWKGSPYYNTTPRLVVLMRELSNELIAKASTFLTGDRLFELMDNDEAGQAVEAIRTLLRVLGGFKAAFFDFKAKSAIEVPENPWTAANNACFHRLDKFLERCHDVLDMAQTMMQYKRLDGLEVGGTKGRSLSTSAMQIFSDFVHAVDKVRNLDYDIMDLSQKDFDVVWYEFRKDAKLLDQRLAVVVVEGFKDCTTVMGSFKLFQSFEGLTERPVLVQTLEERYVEVVVLFAADLLVAQHVFLQGKEDPPCGHNLPPVAGALLWAQGLEERVKQPMDKIKRLNRTVLEHVAAREALADYTTFLGHLSDFKKQHMDGWAGAAAATTQASLKAALLRKEVDTSRGQPASVGAAPPDDSGAFALFVNLDPHISSVLREVKYFLILGLPIPAIALEVYARAETLRRHASNLDLICAMYNGVQSSLLPVERPLVKIQLEKVDRLLSQAVEVAGTPDGAATMTWKANGIDQFIGEAMAEVTHVDETLKAMKQNLRRAEEILDAWSAAPLFSRYNKPADIRDFEALQKQLRGQRYGLIKSGGTEIHSLLKDICWRLKVSQGLPDWRSYVDFLNNIVVGGLVQVVIISLENLEQQVDPVSIERQALAPLLAIDIDLVGQDLRFVPEIGHVNLSGASKGDVRKFGIRNIAQSWIDSFFGVSGLFPRLDSGEGSYLKEVQDDPYVQMLLASVNALMVKMEVKGNEYREHFQSYTWLWTTDLQEMFNEFLQRATLAEAQGPKGDAGSDDEGASKDDAEEDSLADEDSVEDDESSVGTLSALLPTDSQQRPTHLNLQKFDAKLRELLAVQTELSELKPFWDCDFLRVNAQPAKQALNTWITKWTFLFTQYLQDYLAERLLEMHGFMGEMRNGLADEVDDGDRMALLRVMGLVRKVRRRMKDMEASFSPLQEIVSLLKAYDIALELKPLPTTLAPGVVQEEEALVFLENAPLLWDEVVNRCFKVRELILPKQMAMVDTIKDELAAFALKVQEFGVEFKVNGPWSHTFHKHETSSSELETPSAAFSSAFDGGTATTGGGGGENDSTAGLDGWRKNEVDALAWCRPAFASLSTFEEALSELEEDARDLKELGELFEQDTDAYLVDPATVELEAEEEMSTRERTEDGVGADGWGAGTTEGSTVGSPNAFTATSAGGVTSRAMQTTTASGSVGSVRKGAGKTHKNSPPPAPRMSFSAYLEELRLEMTRLKKIWDMVSLTRSVFDAWKLKPLLLLDTFQLSKEAKRLQKSVSRTVQPKKLVAHWPAFKGLDADVKQMAASLPLAQDLLSPAMQGRHWRALTQACDQPPKGNTAKQPPFPAVQFGALFALGLWKHGEGVRDVVDAAAKEKRIELKLARIEGAWNDAELAFSGVKGAKSKADDSLELTTKVGVKSAEDDEEGGDTAEDAKAGEEADGEVHVVNRCEHLLSMLEEHLVELEGTHASMSSASVAAKPTAGPKETITMPTGLNGDTVGGDDGDEEGGQEDAVGGEAKTSADFFRGAVEVWQLRLGSVEQVLNLLVKVCRKWQSLEAIYSSEVNEVAANLPDAAKEFQVADKDIRALLSQAFKHPKVLTLCLTDGRLYQLTRCWKILEASQHALDGYLTAKMDSFPRFYLLPAPTLLDIVARGTDPTFVVPLLAPVFDGLSTVEFAHSNVAKRQIAELQAHADNARDAKLSVLERLAGAEADAREERLVAGDLSADDAMTDAKDALAAMQRDIAREGKHAAPASEVAHDAASGMVGKCGELVPFAAIFLFNTQSRPLERWLTALVAGTQDALKTVFDGTMKGVAKWEAELPREKWCVDVTCPSAQALLLAAKVQFTSDTETALDALENGEVDAMIKYEDVLSLRLDSLVSLVQTNLSDAERTRIATLVTSDLHGRDTVQLMMDNGVTSALDFSWLSQLKYYYAADRLEITVSLGEFESMYSYEYQGNLSRLVLTPLTERCFVTLTTSLRLHLGAACLGPAGTGKAETVKDLGRALGVMCFVFNCGPEFTHHTSANLLTGLSQTGCWGCFTHLNRVESNVLSVFATHAKAVLDAVKKFSVAGNREGQFASLPDGLPPVKVGDFDLNGTSIGLVPTVGLFMCMNPSSSLYNGRTELPETLKTLFRPCAMATPDSAQVAEVLLVSQGFEKGNVLASKLACLFKLCTTNLSLQPHYDWSLRGMLSVVRLCGAARRANNGVDEEALFMAMLRDGMAPKLPSGNRDAEVFTQLLADMFPGKTLEAVRNQSLVECCERVCEDQGLQASKGFTDKVLQYQDLLDVRHCVVLVGPPGCGKSTVWQTLAKCHNATAQEEHAKQQKVKDEASGGAASAADDDASGLESALALQTNTEERDGDGGSEGFKAVTVFETLNPNAVSTHELFGFMTTTNKTWREGCLSHAMREMSHETAPKFGPHQTSKWVVLDGDVDSAWVEGLNTVADGNRVLTLASNERVLLTASMKVVLEVGSLSHATPATVSRAGVLFLNDTDVGFGPALHSWLRNWSSNGQNGKSNGQAPHTVPPASPKPSKSPKKGKKDGKGFPASPSSTGDHASAAASSFAGASVSPAVLEATETTRSMLRDLFGRHVPGCFAILHNSSMATLVPIEPIAMVQTLCALLEALLKHCPPELRTDAVHVEKLFVFACVWAFGGVSAGDDGSTASGGGEDKASFRHHSRQAFSAAFREHLAACSEHEVAMLSPKHKRGTSGSKKSSNHHNSMGSSRGSSRDRGKGGSKRSLSPKESVFEEDGLGLLFPSEGSVFDYFVGSGRHARTWVKWSDAVPAYVPSLGAASFASLAVSTVDGTRLDYLCSLLLEVKRPVLLVGGAATGKTSVLAGLLRSHEERTSARSVAARLNFFSDAKALQTELEAPLERRGGRVFGPKKGGKELVWFVDDLNMPKVQTGVGTQSAVELLRQWADYREWCNRRDLTQKRCIVGCSLVAAMNHQAGSFHVSRRLQRHFACLACHPTSDEDAQLIYGSILGSHLSLFSPNIQAAGPSLVAATLALYKDASARFLPSTQKFHYRFTLRDLASVFEGLCLSKPNLYRSSLSVCRLWYHECVRVFSDRLVSAQEGLRLKASLRDVAKRFLSDHSDDALFAEPCIFTHFATPACDDDDDDERGVRTARKQVSFDSATAGPASDHFSTDFSGNGVGSYLAVADETVLRSVLDEKLAEYNDRNVMMSLVLFQDAAEHVCRIARVLARPRGNALLVGVGGSGKQSLAKLAAFVCGFAVQVMGDQRHNLSDENDDGVDEGEAYTEQEFRKELKVLYRCAAIHPAKPIVFMVSDCHLAAASGGGGEDDEVAERLLVLVDALLATGMVPQLFGGGGGDDDGGGGDAGGGGGEQEMSAVLEELKPAALAEGVPVESRSALLDFFVERVRANVHVVLCFSPSSSPSSSSSSSPSSSSGGGSVLRRRCLRFPSLVTCTTVDWFHAWPKDALVAVAHSCLNKLPQLKEHDAAMVAEAKALATSSDKRRSTLVAQSKGTGGDAAGEGQESKLAENLAHHMATIHCGVQDASTRFLANEKRFAYAPPASFLELIESFAHLLRTHSSKVGRDIERLELGSATLAKTAEAVESLKDELEFKQVEVESKRQAAEDVLREMGNKSAAAEAASEAGASEREKAEEHSREALSLQTQAAGDLASAEPFLEEAKEAVEALTAELMNEFKGLKKLPSGVDKVTAAVLMLVKNERKDFSWENAKVMVSRFDSFVGKLASTTGEHIDPEVVHRVQPILDDPMFTFEKMRSKSEAAGHLCKWVHSITSFHKVYRRVQPLMAMLAGAQEAKAQAGLDLEAVEAELRRLDRRLAQLKLDFVTAMREKQLCEDAASSCGQRLRLAERLTSSLQSERERWGQRLDILRRLRGCVAGDAMLSAAFATYAGPFTAGLRTALNGSWAKDLSSREVPLSTTADPLTLLAPPASVAAWQACGLPKERMCCENGAVLLAAFSSRWPLLIDPQGQGVAFVKAWENKSEERDGAAKAAELEMKRIEGGEERRSGPEALTMAPASADAFQIEEQNRGDEEGGVGGGDEAAAGGSVAGTARSATTLKRKAEAEGRGLVVLHTSQPRWLRELSAAVSAGLAVVLQGLGDGTPPACLDPLLRKAFYRKGRSVFVGLCGQEVEYDPSFRLYLQTTLANPHFTPEVCARCRLVNFAVSQPALEAQILSLVVTLEQPELEEERAGLTETFTRHKQELRLLEDGILARLAHAPPDLLSETALIDTLENCKEKASAVEAAVVRAHKIEAGVERVRLQYRSLAAEAAGFYFLASALSLLHPLYRFSLSLFLRTLARSVSECDEADEVPRRVSLLRKSCRQALFLFVRRGLFEKHRLAFQAQAVFQFMGNDKEHFEAVELRKAEKERQRKEANGGEDDSGDDEDEDEVDEFGNSVERLNVREWSEAKPKDTGFSPQGVAFLLNSCGQSQGRQVAAGGSQGVVDPLSSRPSPAEWLSETSWRLAGLLSKEVAGFSSFQQDLSDSAPRFLEWFEHASPESEKLPLEWRLLDNKPFKKLLAIRVLRPDRFGEALHMYARRVGLGKEFTNEADSSLSQFEVLDSAFLDASSDVPVLLALSKGSDALSDVHRLAAKYGLVAGTSYHCVSLGSGQTALAEVRLWQAHRGGHWVLLSDAHLAPRGWLETCLWLLASFALEGSHPNFRVVFTADATAASGLKDQVLPIALLEACVVVVYDPPGGVKGRLKKALCSFDRDALEELEPMHRGALFGLCHFHSAMAERRRYGAIGFNEGASYSWGGADLRHSASLLESLMADAPVVPWAEVRHLLGSAVHGGHVSDPWDQRVVSSYLGFLMKDGLNEEMELFPFADTTRGSTGFTSPTTSKSVKNVLEHVDKKFVQSDTCLAVGLHPNNEIALKTDNTLTLLTTLRDLERVSPFALGKPPEPDDTSLAQGGVNPIGVAEMVLQDVTEQIKGVGFDLEAIESACVTEGVGPFQHVYLNECARLNELVGTMAGTLGELDKGLKGELAMSDAMELLLTALATDKVPTPWRQFPSLRNLTGWLVHVSKRIAQMAKWERKPTQVPVVTWISGLFNPVALLSAIMQQSARDNVLELDQLVAYTEVTKKHDVEDFPVRAKDGCYCVGLTLEGARYTVNSQTLEPQLPRKLLNKMPVICLRAKVDERADGGGNRGEDDDGGEGGGGSGEKGMFECPVYMTQSRGLSEFVFSAGLRTRVPSAKWVLAGVALVMDAADVE